MKIRKHSYVIYSAFLITMIFTWLLVSCDSKPAKTEQQDGKTLSKKICSSCHSYPDASLLDQDSWINHVLPAMAPRLGIQVYAGTQYVNNPSSTSAVTYSDWLKIVDYYKTISPQNLKPARKPTAPVKDWGVFVLRKPAQTAKPLATTTLVAFDTIGKNIYTSEMMGNSVFQWNDELKLKATKVFSSPAVDVKFNKESNGNQNGVFTFIGSMRAIDVANGSVKSINLEKFNDTAPHDNIIADSLPRPVQSLPADFNKDGLMDWLVCNFGHNTGGLYWYRQLANKKCQKTTIRDVPGAEQATIGDFNNDGWPDIACLFAQADEGIWLFLNDHKGSFTTKNLLRFPPVYGSSSFQLVDFNNDGKLDILYTAGDNGDYSKVLKPYHGVYIFLNQGNFKYKKAYFYPVNGATKALAADFNGDGKPDIALIAFYADLQNNPDEGFTYFEQGNTMQFTPHNLLIANQGRWICMDVGDYNSDGKPDIILGNFSLGFINQDGFKPNWNTKTPFIILENQNHTKQIKRK